MVRYEQKMIYRLLTACVRARFTDGLPECRMLSMVDDKHAMAIDYGHIVMPDALDDAASAAPIRLYYYGLSVFTRLALSRFLPAPIFRRGVTKYERWGACAFISALLSFTLPSFLETSLLF